MMGIHITAENPVKTHKLENREGIELRPLSSMQVTCRCNFKDLHAEYMGQHFPTLFYVTFDIPCVYILCAHSQWVQALRGL